MATFSNIHKTICGYQQQKVVPTGGDSEGRDASRKKKLSGAGRRKPKKLRKVQTTLPARRTVEEKGENLCDGAQNLDKEPIKQAPSGVQKGIRTDSSTHKEKRPTKNSRAVEPNISYKAAVSDIWVDIRWNPFIRTVLISGVNEIEEGICVHYFQKHCGGILQCPARTSPVGFSWSGS